MKKKLSTCMVLFLLGTYCIMGCSSEVGENAQPMPATAEAVDEEETAEAPEASEDPSQETTESSDKHEETDDPDRAEEGRNTSDDAEQEGNLSSNEDIEKAVDAYASFIEEKAADSETWFLSFTMIHLDEDDIPELAIAYGDSHADGVSFYGYDETGVNEICHTGSLGLAYYEKEGGIAYGWYTGQGETWYNINVVKNGKLVETIMPVIATQYDENFEETGYKYYLEEESSSISKEEFEEILAPYDPENRQYRELEYSKMHDVHEVTDIKQTLKDSIAEEDNLPQPNLEFFHDNIITGV